MASARRQADGGGLWRLWLTGALIWLISTPLVWKQYNLISPMALVLNFLMWLPVTLAMYSGLGTLVFGSLTPLAGRVCGLACDRCLHLLERLIAWGRDWPGGYFWLPAPPTWWIGVFYIAIAIMVAFPRLRPSRRWAIALAMMWAAGAVAFGPGIAAVIMTRGHSFAISSPWATAWACSSNCRTDRTCSTTPAGSARRWPACGPFRRCSGRAASRIWMPS